MIRPNLKAFTRKTLYSEINLTRQMTLKIWQIRRSHCTHGTSRDRFPEKNEQIFDKLSTDLRKIKQ